MLCDSGIVPSVGDAIPPNATRNLYSFSNYVTVRYLRPSNPLRPPRPPSQRVHIYSAKKRKENGEKEREREGERPLRLSPCAWKFTMLYSGDVYTVEVGPS